MNNCEFIGNLTKDVILRTTKTGMAVSSFSIACNRIYVNKQTGEKKEIADFVNIQAWDFLAKKAAAGLKKGSRVYIKGRLNTRSYDAANGEKKWITEVIADTVEPISYVQMGNQQQTQFAQQQAPQNQQFGGDFSQFGQPENEQIPF